MACTRLYRHTAGPWRVTFAFVFAPSCANIFLWPSAYCFTSDSSHARFILMPPRRYDNVCVSDAVLRLVCGACKALRFLSVSSASQVSRAAVLEARRAHRLLNIHYDTSPPADPLPAGRTFYDPAPG